MAIDPTTLRQLRGAISTGVFYGLLRWTIFLILLGVLCWVAMFKVAQVWMQSRASATYDSWVDDETARLNGYIQRNRDQPGACGKCGAKLRSSERVLCNTCYNFDPGLHALFGPELKPRNSTSPRTDWDR